MLTFATQPIECAKCRRSILSGTPAEGPINECEEGGLNVYCGVAKDLDAWTRFFRR